MRIVYFAVTLALSLFPRLSSAATCPSSLYKTFSLDGYERCQCGGSLKNITITLPPSLTLAGACGLYLPPSNEPINLEKTKVTFDDYTDGWIPFGRILILGKVTLKGVLRIEEGPAGTYWFYPKPRIVPKKTALSEQIATIEFEDEKEFKKLNIPKRLQSESCLMVDATMEADNLHILIGDTDEAGARPVRYRLIEAGNYRLCKE